VSGIAGATVWSGSTTGVTTGIATAVVLIETAIGTTIGGLVVLGTEFILEAAV
jgi:hypothetical protein